MSPVTKISKETILKTALSLIIHEGYSALNIKRLAKEIGCSTQPISWHFGNMEGLRKELTEYALSYVNEKMRAHEGDGLSVFQTVGTAYIDLAFDTPHLFRYLYMSGDSGYKAGGFDVLIQADENAGMVEHIARDMHLPKEAIAHFFQNTMIYTHGLASFVVSGLIRATKEEVMNMMMDAVAAFFTQAQETQQNEEEMHEQQ